MPTRTPEEIRASIEQNRQELGESVARLRDEVTQFTDWRAQLRARQSQLLPVAVVGGFVLGGGIAGITGLIRRPGRGGSSRGGKRPSAKDVRAKLRSKK